MTRAGDSADSADSGRGLAVEGAVRSAVRAVLLPPTGRPVHAVYGTVLTAGLIAAQDPDHSSAREIVFAVATTVVVFWLAHGYAHAVGHRVRPDAGPCVGRGFDPGAGRGWVGVRWALAENWPMVRAAFPPLAALAIAHAAGASVDHAQEAALWTSLVLLCAWGLFAGHTGGLRRWRLAAYTAGIALLGLVLIGLEVAIH